MKPLSYLRERISPQNSLLLLYHRIMAMIAALWYRFPANRLKVIAVTGTKGKSTVVHLIARILKEAGHRVGVTSTIDFQIGDTVFPNTTKQSTQGPFMLQKLLREMVRARCEFAVIEATSHALVQSRLWGVNVDTAVLTNIAKDHLEYHGGFENYLHAKGTLFENLGRSERKFGLQKTAILPSEDTHTSYFEAFQADRHISYGVGKGIVHAGEIKLTADGSVFALKVPNGEIEVALPMPGEFNVRNALAAAAATLAFGIKLSVIQKGLQTETQIPGRLETIHVGQPFTVVVDYAHTEDSLEKLLSLFRSLTIKKLFVVFGATGGGRDKGKRPAMGKIAATYADYVVVTDDDPYTEDRMEIINQVSAGVGRKEGEGFWKIRDRREAMRLALSLAQEGDTVVIAGKGCESVQMVGERIEWDDRKVARELLSNEVRVQL